MACLCFIKMWPERLAKFFFLFLLFSLLRPILWEKKVCENKNKITMAWGKKIRKYIYIVNLVKNFYHNDTISSYIPNACLVLIVTFPCTCKHSCLYSLSMVSTPSTLLFMEQFMKYSILKANNKTILYV